MWHTATIFVETMIISVYCGSVTGFAAGVKNCLVLIELDPKPTEDGGNSFVDFTRFWSNLLKKYGMIVKNKPTEPLTCSIDILKVFAKPNNYFNLISTGKIGKFKCLPYGENMLSFKEAEIIKYNYEKFF